MDKGITREDALKILEAQIDRDNALADRFEGFESFPYVYVSED